MKKRFLVITICASLVGAICFFNTTKALSDLEIIGLFHQFSESWVDIGDPSNEQRTDSFDIYAVIEEDGNENTISTTFSEDGYASYIKVQDNEQFFDPTKE